MALVKVLSILLSDFSLLRMTASCEQAFAESFKHPEFSYTISAVSLTISCHS